MKKYNNGFAIIEILVWIVIFTLWLTGVYTLILSTMNLNEYSKNSIIATNLARESLENIRNLRDNNYKNLYKWNKLPGISNFNDFFSTWVYYIVENDDQISSDKFLKMDPISDFAEGKEFLSTKMQSYQLCWDGEHKYTYDCHLPNTKTYFYRYIKFDEVMYNSWWVNLIIPNSLQLTSKVIWQNRWYHEIALKTILTDYLRQ